MIVATIGVLAGSSRAGAGFLHDFGGDLYDGGRTVLRGVDPYDPKALEAQVAVLRAGGKLGWIASARYPPPVLFTAIPLSLLPVEPAGVLFMLGSIGAVIAALRLLDVRDWRCIAVASVSAPTVYGAWIGNLSPLLLLAAAAMWRWRFHPRLLTLAGGCAIGAKLFLWPLAAWLLVTRRYRELVGTVAVTTVGIIGAWAVIGFAGLASYPGMLVNIAYMGEVRGSSLVTALLDAGLPMLVARAIAVAFAAALIAAARRLSRVSGGDGRCFGLVVTTALIASPVVWLHSLVLLFVPIALISPGLSLLWFLPALASFSPTMDVALELIVIGSTCLPLVRLAPGLHRSPAGRASTVRATSGRAPA